MPDIGLYIHIPFCNEKCPYCDFYSLSAPSSLLLDDYTEALIRAISHWSVSTAATADTVYFGGGTPSMLGAVRLSRIMAHIRRSFSVSDNVEITMEVNPSSDLSDILSAFNIAGGNRLSIGMQSAHEKELQLLGRKHSLADVEKTVTMAQKIGLDNISLDLMLGIPASTVGSVRHSVNIAADIGAKHISAYMLKIEPQTPFGHHPPPLPNDDLTADMYLAAMDALDTRRFTQYEISNTAVPGYESAHNLKYWRSLPYIGIGPAASSCLDGHRFTYSRDIQSFMTGTPPIEDDETSMAVGSQEEYVCLQLRLNEGVQEKIFAQRFGYEIPSVWRQRADALPPALIVCDTQGIRLTRQGFLVSNSLIRYILGE